MNMNMNMMDIPDDDCNDDVTDPSAKTVSLVLEIEEDEEGGE